MADLLDSHIHLFDTGRVQGVPYPSKDNAVLYQPALPARYRALAAPLGVSGAIAVEASPWVEDNLWLLEAAAMDPFIVGVVGNLEPESNGFREMVDRYARNRLFKGIRYGNLWGRSLRKAVETRAFVEGVKHLAELGLALDTANPDRELLEGVVRLVDQVSSDNVEDVTWLTSAQVWAGVLPSVIEAMVAVLSVIRVCSTRSGSVSPPADGATKLDTDVNESRPCIWPSCGVKPACDGSASSSTVTATWNLVSSRAVLWAIVKPTVAGVSSLTKPWKPKIWCCSPEPPDELTPGKVS